MGSEDSDDRFASVTWELQSPSGSQLVTLRHFAVGGLLGGSIGYPGKWVRWE